MRFGLTFLFVLLSFISFSQKNYRIGNIYWEYNKPAIYKTRIDNFSSARKTGDSLIKSNDTVDKQLNDDIVLFSFAKDGSSETNIIMGNYQGDSNIKKFTLKGYANKMVEFLKYNDKKIGLDNQTILKELTIDSIKFYVIESKIYSKERNLTSWTRMYIAEVSGKELNIVVTYDNANDDKVITKSILLSKFHSLK